MAKIFYADNKVWRDAYYEGETKEDKAHGKGTEYQSTYLQKSKASFDCCGNLKDSIKVQDDVINESLAIIKKAEMNIKIAEKTKGFLCALLKQHKENNKKKVGIREQRRIFIRKSVVEIFKNLHNNPNYAKNGIMLKDIRNLIIYRYPVVKVSINTIDNIVKNLIKEKLIFEVSKNKKRDKKYKLMD